MNSEGETIQSELPGAISGIAGRYGDAAADAGSAGALEPTLAADPR